MIIAESTSLSYSSSGRQSVEQRFRFIYGNDISVIKTKGTARQTACQLQGYVLTQAQLDGMLGDTMYPDWADQPNEIHDSAQLIFVESNHASCYLVFKPIS
ncbi:MAG: hypothetical protein AUJ47_09375 [Candidatus Marinimicrobia bacterium CG1_02_48_14]|nr:MAG: hypothetical protein AUJ47_09375 [Candidatus Marinimicrobia bacterium CG1_02_48_14]